MSTIDLDAIAVLVHRRSVMLDLNRATAFIIAIVVPRWASVAMTDLTFDEDAEDPDRSSCRFRFEMKRTNGKMAVTSWTSISAYEPVTSDAWLTALAETVMKELCDLA